MTLAELKQYQKLHRLPDDTEIRFCPEYIEHVYDKRFNFSHAGRVVRIEKRPGVIVLHDAD
jgi:hypothetical protein